ncbi:MAG TPA: hypothetical protein PKD68_03385 [Candidatus Saccharibacteria bacterium]|nr:hypothetical protein [Candidatus Saccharibacteria bacterium]
MESLGWLLLIASGALMIMCSTWMQTAPVAAARWVMAFLALFFTVGAALGSMLLGGWFLVLAVLVVTAYVAQLVRVLKMGRLPV